MKNNEYNYNWRKANSKLIYYIACADAIGISYGQYISLKRDCMKMNPRAIKRAIELTKDVKVDLSCLE